MNIKIDTHTHTIISGHAYSTIAEMANSAKEKGLEILAITDHAPEMYGSAGMFYFQNLHVIPRYHYGIPILFGVELNIMDASGTVDIPSSICEQLDIVVASIHPVLLRDELTKEGITSAYVNAMKKPYIHIIGHPDDNRCRPDYEVLIKTAKHTNTLLEINDSSMRKGSFREGAFDNIVQMLTLCKQYGVSVTTGSDAHVDADVGNFIRTKEVLQYVNFPEELVVTTSKERLAKFVDLNEVLI